MQMAPFADDEGIGGRSSPPVVDQRKYSTFIDDVLDHVCCAPSSSIDDGNDIITHHGRTVHEASNDGGIGGGCCNGLQQSEDGQQKNNNNGHPNPLQQQPQSAKKQTRRRKSTGNISNSSGSVGTTILPHLRFNTLPASTSTSSSLQDFFNLFLADNAPHSFSKFHEMICDTNIHLAPWKVNINNTNTIDRTINFITKITPGSSSNPLSNNSNDQSDDKSVAGSGNNDNNSRTIIPLNVTILQSLIQYHPKHWKLICQFSFDFSGTTTSAANNSPIASIDSSERSVSSSVSKKLGQFVMSNFMKTSAVTVCVTLNECEEGGHIEINSAQENGGVQQTTAATNKSSTSGSNDNIQKKGVQRGKSDGNSSVPSHTRDGQEQFSSGMLSCFSHPLLLPPEGLCSSHSNGGGSSKSSRGGRNKKNGNNKNGKGHTNSANGQQQGGMSVNTEEPSQVGASLLSAIRAKNACSDDDGGGCSFHESLVKSPFFCGSLESTLPSCTNKTMPRRSKSEGYQNNNEEDYDGFACHDVLSCNSRGALRMKNIPSFELSRSTSNVSMRRMILNKDGNSPPSSAAVSLFASGSGLNVGGASTAIRSKADVSNMISSPSSSPSAAASHPQGLSMQIQMELETGGYSSSPSNSSISGPSLSKASSFSSFSTSISVSTIDDKVRRGLKKRIARSWISWAESWCMRLWEEEEAERTRRISKGESVSGNVVRSKKNVRPQVRRIGEPRIAKPKFGDKSKPRSKSVSPPKNEWSQLRSTNRRSERWMLLDGQDGECGIEVDYSSPVKPAPKVVAKLEPPKKAPPKQQQATSKKSPIKKRLLRRKD